MDGWALVTAAVCGFVLGAGVLWCVVGVIYHRAIRDLFALQDAHERAMQMEQARFAAEHSGMPVEAWYALFHELQEQIHAMARKEA